MTSAINLVYVGTYSEPIVFGTGQTLHGKGRGIYANRFDPQIGALYPQCVTEGVRNSSYIAFDPTKRFLFCVNEYKEYEGRPSGAVSAFKVNQSTGELTYLNSRASYGTDPCHLKVDATGNYLAVANFASGSVCVLPIGEDGFLGEAVQVIQHEGSSLDAKRQAGPHAHAVEFDKANRFLFVPDLGLDKVMIYEFDEKTGLLTPNARQPWVTTAPGSGPRQLAMSPDGNFAYLINELNSTLTAYRYNNADGSLNALNTLSTLPATYAELSTCAEVQVTPDGKFLYGSNRGHDSLAIFAIDSNTGQISLVGHESTRGKIPRNFDISKCGRFLAVANQDSNNIVMFGLDPSNGHLTLTGSEISVGTPICVRFI
jgi:6-phosphogluconolactonase